VGCLKQGPVIFLVLMLCLVTAGETAAFRGGSTSMRCGTVLVSLGDTKLETLLKCGEPVWRETLAGGCCPGSYLRRDGRRFKTYSGFFEEWTYNFGPQQFMRILRFQNGRLMDIELGGYGY
jgi:hypothetical protein